MPSKDPDAIKEVRRRHYERNREKVIAQARVRTRRYAEEVRTRLIAIKEAAGCADCRTPGLPHYMLQFDHVRGEKKFHLCDAARRQVSRARLDEEIAKCEVVCANCHCIRTWKRRTGIEPA